MSKYISTKRNPHMAGLRIGQVNSAPEGSALAPLVAVFQLGGIDGLPLHVARLVQASSAEGNDMVDDVARAGAAR